MGTTTDENPESTQRNELPDRKTDPWAKLASCLDLPDQNKDYDVYLKELASNTLDRLKKEPERLRKETEHYKQQIEDVAVRHYRSFLESAETVDVVNTIVVSMRDEVTSLISRLPKLDSACEQFSNDAAAIAKKRKINRTTLQQHNVLLELLEIPQLMDTCVRNGFYEEALDLESYAQLLRKKHPNLDVIEEIGRDVDNATVMMVKHLVQLLHSNIQLPTCLRVIGYLRRLSSFDEARLRQEFIGGRDAYLAGILSDIPRNDQYNYLVKYTDLYRVHVFEIVNQYRAIFADEVAEDGTTAESPDGGLLFRWATILVDGYLVKLRRGLSEIKEGVQIAGVLERANYCSLSLARVGVDFRVFLPGIFEEKVVGDFTKSISTALNDFVAQTNTPWEPAPQKSSRASARADDDMVIPPYELLEHIPLALLANGYMSALNELRHVAFATVRVRCFEGLLESFGHISNTLENHKSSGRFTNGEGPYERLCKCAATHLLPHVSKCLASIFGTKSIEGTKELIEKLEKLAVVEKAPKEAEEVPPVVELEDTDGLPAAAAEGTVAGEPAVEAAVATEDEKQDADEPAAGGDDD